MLTKEALRERQWGRYRTLGAILRARSVPPSYYGPTSIPDNTFSWLNRIAEVAVITKEHAADIRDATDPQLVQDLPKDLDSLEHELHAAGRFFTDHADFVRTLKHQVYEHEKRRRQAEHQRNQNEGDRNTQQ